MLFNLHHGQVRFSSIQTGSKAIFRPKSPKGVLLMKKIDGTPYGKYTTDKLGNIDIVAPEHVDVMVGLGYPIYDGDGVTFPSSMRDMIYPNLDPTSPYWRKIQEAKQQSIKL